MILKLAVVENFGHRGVFAVRNHDQVKPLFLGELEGVAGIDEPLVLVFMIDQQHLRCPNLPVDQLSLRNKSFLQEFDSARMELEEPSLGAKLSELPPQIITRIA